MEKIRVLLTGCEWRTLEQSTKEALQDRPYVLKHVEFIVVNENHFNDFSETITGEPGFIVLNGACAGGKGMDKLRDQGWERTSPMYLSEGLALKLADKILPTIS